ncbi:Ribosomal large subunit pseudouridine synthase C [Novipirellula galeiformis]|uniref:Ribosomal large subunit pseudouridine synthase C n=1 Tax=Novipirellula galeiformis TaxID=2528004 RepID=A0A5C6CPB6_9BACT|nr:RluA family pseudouridine synthase [Novipirellula galeiformis]TWU26228.1 Ribosomal large subunit pseudouridine synthase C [Novipirellula galeiformis]
MSELEIIFEDNHLLVLNKPAELITMGAETGPTLHIQATEYLRKRYNKPGRAYLGIVSRLDSMTSGIIVMAKTSKAASRLTPQFSGQGKDLAAKTYLAVLEGCLDNEYGELVDHVAKNDAARRMETVPQQRDGAQLARLRYVCLAATPTASLVAVRLLTGRKHQIRLQFENLGFPVWGDRKYDAKNEFEPGIGLHSWKLEITHPTLRERIGWSAPLPESWQKFGKLIPSRRNLVLDKASEERLSSSR